MYTLRATAKLLKRPKSVPDPSPPFATSILGDWYANLHVLRPAHLVLAVSERTLLPVLVPGRDIAGLPERIGLAVGDMLRAIGVPEPQIIRELRHMCEWTIAKTASRSVIGTMNDFAWMLDAQLREPMTLLDRALLLAECPCKPIGMDSPRRVTLNVFDVGTETTLRVIH